MMLNYISPLEKLFSEAAEYQEQIEKPLSEDLNEIEYKGNYLTVVLARTGKMLADAKYHQDKAVKQSMINVLKEKISPSLAKQLIEASCEKENYLVNWLDRLNRTCVHQLDWARSVLSKGKMEMQYGQFQK